MLLLAGRICNGAIFRKSPWFKPAAFTLLTPWSCSAFATSAARNRTKEQEDAIASRLNEVRLRSPRRNWTKEEQELMLLRTKEGASIHSISAELGRSYPSIYQRMRRIGAFMSRRRPRKIWSESEYRTIRAAVDSGKKW